MLADPLDTTSRKSQIITAVSFLPSWLSSLSLHHQFALVGSFVSFLGMLLLGAHVSSSIETSVVRNSAISSAVYMESFIAPLSQELATTSELAPETIERMQKLLGSPPLSERVLFTKIWRENGLIAFSSDPKTIGSSFPPSAELLAAWDGALTATFDQLEEEENLIERAIGVPLLEVYNPIHSILTGEVIAVAEFYLDATELKRDLNVAYARSWAIVFLVSGITFAALLGIVRAGSRTIASQNQALEAKLDEVARISDQNTSLRDRVQAAARRVSETNERYMRRVSAELHDGPAQAIALASLRLDALLSKSAIPSDNPEARTVRSSLNEALSDVRDLCRGLTLPELEGRTLEDTLEMAISAHERRTGQTIRRVFQNVHREAHPATHPILICVYRFTQEALMNTFRHANGASVSVDCQWQGDRFALSVSDAGPGFDTTRKSESGLGLGGLRERVESIGGEFFLTSEPNSGTRLTCCLQMDPMS